MESLKDLLQVCNVVCYAMSVSVSVFVTVSVSVSGYFSVCCREPLNSRLYPIILRRFFQSNHSRIAVANMRRAHEYSTSNITEYIRALLVDPTVVHKSTTNPSGLDRTNPVNQHQTASIPLHHRAAPQWQRQRQPQSSLPQCRAQDYASRVRLDNYRHRHLLLLCSS